MDADDESFFNAAPKKTATSDGWKPILGGDGTVIFANLLKFAGVWEQGVEGSV